MIRPQNPAADYVWLVADPTTFVEPVLLTVPGQRPGWVRVRRFVPGTEVGNITGTWMVGNCELIGDEAIVRDLLAQ